MVYPAGFPAIGLKDPFPKMHPHLPAAYILPGVSGGAEHFFKSGSKDIREGESVPEDIGHVLVVEKAEAFHQKGAALFHKVPEGGVVTPGDAHLAGKDDGFSGIIFPGPAVFPHLPEKGLQAKFHERLIHRHGTFHGASLVTAFIEGV